MPQTTFDALPADARVWVFGADTALDRDGQTRLLAAVDGFLGQWSAHGNPLTCARDWREERFLAVGVDQSTAGASGCSIDGLFRALSALEGVLGTRLLGGGRVFYRDATGAVQAVERATFAARAASGEVNPDTHVFDTSVTLAANWRERFELPASASWHAELLGAPARARA